MAILTFQGLDLRSMLDSRIITNCITAASRTRPRSGERPSKLLPHGLGGEAVAQLLAASPFHVSGPARNSRCSGVAPRHFAAVAGAVACGLRRDRPWRPFPLRFGSLDRTRENAPGPCFPNGLGAAQPPASLAE